MKRKARTLSPRIVPLVVLLFWCLVPWETPALANPKLSELERKIADLALLQEQLAHRIEQIQGIRGSLAEQRTMLTSEVHQLAKNLPIKTLQQAQEQIRLRNNIELLRTVLTYGDELDAKVLFYQNGRERLAYLSRLAEDDIRMISALNDLKIDALTTQISLVINRYLPEAHAIQIDPQRVTLLSSQQIWDRIIKEK
jgi:hypothetical protein